MLISRNKNYLIYFSSLENIYFSRSPANIHLDRKLTLVIPKINTFFNEELSVLLQTYNFSEMNSDVICTTNWSLHFFSFTLVYEVGTDSNINIITNGLRSIVILYNQTIIESNYFSKGLKLKENLSLLYLLPIYFLLM